MQVDKQDTDYVNTEAQTPSKTVEASAASKDQESRIDSGDLADLREGDSDEEEEPTVTELDDSDIVDWNPDEERTWQKIS